MIGPNNQLPKKKAGVKNAHLNPLLHDKDDNWADDVVRAATRSRPQGSPDVFEALDLFPQPKSVLAMVVQMATSPSRISVSRCISFSLHLLCLT